MSYRVVFDASDWFGAPLWIPAVALLGVAIAVAAACYPAPVKVRGRGKADDSREIPIPLIRWSLAGFFAFWALGMSYLALRNPLVLGEAARKGQCELIEGTVSDFVPMPFGGHGFLRFTVKGVPFAFSESDLWAGFGESVRPGGPVRAGAPVRICYARTSDRRGGPNVILRLEAPA